MNGFLISDRESQQVGAGGNVRHTRKKANTGSVGANLRVRLLKQRIFTEDSILAMEHNVDDLMQNRRTIHITNLSKPPICLPTNVALYRVNLSPSQKCSLNRDLSYQSARSHYCYAS